MIMVIMRTADNVLGPRFICLCAQNSFGALVCVNILWLPARNASKERQRGKSPFSFLFSEKDPTNKARVFISNWPKLQNNIFLFPFARVASKAYSVWPSRRSQVQKKKKVVFLSLRCWACPFSIFPRTQSSNNEDNDRVWFLCSFQKLG